MAATKTRRDGQVLSQRVAYDDADPTAPVEEVGEGAGDHAPRPRDLPRPKIETEIGVSTESNFFTGLTENLEDGGLFVSSYQALAVGTAVTVSFELPEGRRVTADGRVAWLREACGDVGPGLGIRLVALGPDDERAILQFMQERPPLFYDL